VIALLTAVLRLAAISFAQLQMQIWQFCKSANRRGAGPPGKKP
jgi:hypothetical protein